MTIIGEPDDDDTDHFMTCPVCGVRFDMRDLGQAFDHIHDGPEMPTIVLPPPPTRRSSWQHRAHSDALTGGVFERRQQNLT